MFNSSKIPFFIWVGVFAMMGSAGVYAKSQNGKENMRYLQEIVGNKFDYVFSKDAIYQLHFIDNKHLDVIVKADPSYAPGTLNHFKISITPIRPHVYMITWSEPKTGNTVTHVDDFAKHISYTNITDIASKGFWRLKGVIKPLR